MLHKKDIKRFQKVKMAAIATRAVELEDMEFDKVYEVYMYRIDGILVRYMCKYIEKRFKSPSSTDPSEVDTIILKPTRQIGRNLKGHNDVQGYTLTMRVDLYKDDWVITELIHN